MNNRERLLKTFQHEEPDRVLTHCRGVLPNGTFWRDWQMTVAEDLEDEDVLILPGFGDLTMQKWLGLDIVLAGIPIIVNYPRHSLPGHEGPHKRRVGWQGSINESRSHGGLPYSWYIGGYFKREEIQNDWYEKYGNPFDEEYRPGPSHQKAFKKKLDVLEERNYPFVLVAQTGSFWEILMEGLGYEGIAYAMRKNKTYLHRYINQIKDAILYAWKLILELDVDVIGIADDLGQKGRGLLHPDQWKEFIGPAFKELTDFAHKKGAYTWMHSCGFIENFLRDLIDHGLDAIQSLEPASGVDIERVTDKYGDKMTFVGGMDSTRTLSWGTVDEVIADTKKCLKAGMPNGGYIAGPAHRIIDCPVENVVAMRDTIKKFGKYPCKL
ncbi:MAG: hypothetical protein GF364_09245 [Candidatus Lokiarchaeota archaeon]|nr:hypothetical protein [Candidatus Lokiarchaeota archaeon]